MLKAGNTSEVSNKQVLSKQIYSRDFPDLWSIPEHFPDSYQML